MKQFSGFTTEATLVGGVGESAGVVTSARATETVQSIRRVEAKVRALQTSSGLGAEALAIAVSGAGIAGTKSRETRVGRLTSCSRAVAITAA